MPPNAQDDPQTLVSTAWLAAHLADRDLCILDASWHMPDAGRNAQAEYREGHIPGARFFDLDDVSDKRSALPHMAPSPEVFADRMRDLGLGDGQQVVIYDSVGIFSAPRVWWTFRLMGWTDVAVLDGGLPKWLAEDRALENHISPVQTRQLTLNPQKTLVRNLAEVAQASQTGGAGIVDARAAPRFRGAVPEPRAGLRAGHIPGARNLPFAMLMNPDGTMKSADSLRDAVAEAGVDLSKPVITTCGSGVTAAIVSLALERIGHRDHALYDGAWTEWGSRSDLPLAKG